MAILFPSQAAIQDVFSKSSPLGLRRTDSKPSVRTPKQARNELYHAWSVVDDAKDKTAKLSNAAVAELQKAASKAQPKTGQLELFSPQYYAACAFGGLLACVR